MRVASESTCSADRIATTHCAATPASDCAVRSSIGLDVNGALIGERWRIGPQVVLEVSCPRIPCATFQGWLEREGWIKRFTQAALPGAYLRVIEPGEIRAGDPVEIVHRPDHDVSVALVFRAMTLEPELLPRLLVADALPEAKFVFGSARALRQRT